MQWFLKPLFFEVPQREKEPVFVGRQWLFQEILSHMVSDLPTNKGVVVTGAPEIGRAHV